MSSQHNSGSNARLHIPRQDKLIVCLGDALRITQTAAALERDKAVAEIVPQKQLVAALQGDPASCALIVYDRPAAYLCQRMIDKIPPIDALAEWKDSASTLVDVLRTYRNRVWLIDLDMLAQYPSVLGERLGLSAATSNMLKKELPPAQDPVLRMLAGALVRREIPAQILAGELEASALNLSNRDRTDAVDGMQAFEHYAQQRDKLEAANTESVAQTLYAEEIFSQLEVAQAETAALRAEFDAAQAQVAARQVELEAAQTESATHKTELEVAQAETAALRAEFDAAQIEITAQEAKLNESRLTQEKMKQRQAEMDSELARVRRDGTALKSAQTVLMQQLDQAQRDLEAHYSEMRSQSAQLETERTRYKVLEQEKVEIENWIHGIQASMSYRMMNPLRRLRLLLKRKGIDG